jgi:4-amino-4-deoxy-L-arabinose transferase-like glycosyltransferase
MLTPLNPLSPRWKTVSLIILGAILLSGGVLRFAGIGAGLPLVFFGDEVDMITHTRAISWSDPNPHMFVWGDLPFYQLRAAMGVMDGVLPIIVAGPVSPSDDYYLARTISALYSLATVLLVFFLGKELEGWTAGLLGAAVMAFTSYPVVAAHFATSEPILGFWSTLAILALVRWQRGCRFGLALFGLALGLAVATKYNAATLAVSVAVVAIIAEWPARNQTPSPTRMIALSAVILGSALLFLVGLLLQESVRAVLAGWTTTGELQPFYENLLRRMLLLGAAAAIVAGSVAIGAWLRLTPCMFAARVATSPFLLKPLTLTVIVFFAVSPYTLIDFPSFVQGVAYSLRKQNLGAVAGYPYGSRSYMALGDTTGTRDVFYYFRVVWDEFGAASLASMFLGIISIWRGFRAGLLPCLALIAATFAMLVTARYHGVRYLYPIWGLLAALAGVGVACAVRLVGDHLRQRGIRKAVMMVLIALLVAPLGFRAWTTIDAEFLSPDTRNAALQWLGQRFEPGTSIARERGTLNLELAGMGFRVHTTDELFEQKSLSEWEREGVRVVLLGEDRRAFYQAHSDQFADVLQQYELLANAGRQTIFRPGDGMKGPVIEAYELP